MLRTAVEDAFYSIEKLDVEFLSVFRMGFSRCLAIPVVSFFELSLVPPRSTASIVRLVLFELQPTNFTPTLQLALPLSRALFGLIGIVGFPPSPSHSPSPLPLVHYRLNPHQLSSIHPSIHLIPSSFLLQR